jgi:hypothetical protein
VGGQAPASKLHRICISTGAYCYILRRTTTYYQVLRRTTRYDHVLRHITPYYEIVEWKHSWIGTTTRPKQGSQIQARLDPEPSPKYVAPTNRHTKIPNDSCPNSACFDDYPKLLHCEIAQPNPWGSSGAGRGPRSFGRGRLGHPTLCFAIPASAK